MDADVVDGDLVGGGVANDWDVIVKLHVAFVEGLVEHGI
jgi:hypothetical protein